MPHVQITLLEGRTLEQRRRVAKRITEVLVEEANASADAVTVAFVDVPRDSFSRGGILICDREKK